MRQIKFLCSMSRKDFEVCHLRQLSGHEPHGSDIPSGKVELTLDLQHCSVEHYISFFPARPNQSSDPTLFDEYEGDPIQRARCESVISEVIGAEGSTISGRSRDHAQALRSLTIDSNLSFKTSRTSSGKKMKMSRCCWSPDKKALFKSPGTNLLDATHCKISASVPAESGAVWKNLRQVLVFKSQDTEACLGFACGPPCQTPVELLSLDHCHQHPC